MRVESLAAKVDFNERRVRGVENTMHQARPAPRPSDSVAQAPSAPMPPREGTPSESQATDGGGAREGAPEGGRRRRRRRRGRRSPMGTPFEGSSPTMQAGEQPVAAGAPGEIDVEPDIDEEEDEPALSESDAPDTQETIASSPPPPQPEPAYVVDRFVSTVQKVPDAPTGSEALSSERAVPEPADEPAAPSTSSAPSADHPRSPEPHEPSDSGSGT